jgi:hypothetical protein
MDALLEEGSKGPVDVVPLPRRGHFVVIRDDDTATTDDAHSCSYVQRRNSVGNR